jgi:hypothetical protein
MIRVKVVKQRGSYQSFLCQGHAGFADSGRDIVCASVSALVITTFNAIEAFTSDPVKASDEEGLVKAEFGESNTPESKLLMDTLLLGLTEIQKEFPQYLKVMIREV